MGHLERQHKALDGKPMLRSIIFDGDAGASVGLRPPTVSAEPKKNTLRNVTRPIFPYLERPGEFERQEEKGDHFTSFDIKACYRH